MYTTLLNRMSVRNHAMAMAAALLLAVGVVSAADEQPARYDTPEAALTALLEACRAKDAAALAGIFGPVAKELVSGDEVSDKADLAEFAARLQEKHGLQTNDDGSRTLLVGPTAHPFAIPLVQKDGKWFFDTVAGKDEVLNRRIGANELNTIAVCRAYVIAQREYYRQDRDGDEVLEYAQRLGSTPGQRDGLYWEARPGETLSPLGEFVADARAEGYGQKDSASSKEENKPRPYHGYVYKILTAQAGSAPGGKLDYVINGNMVAGFALLAYPVDYGNSGIMTFIVNSNGIVYQKDLGEDTEKLAAGIKAYERDETWAPAED